MEKVYWGMLFRMVPVKESWKLSCDTFPVDPPSSSETEMTLQRCPQWKKGALASGPRHCSIMGLDCGWNEV